MSNSDDPTSESTAGGAPVASKSLDCALPEIHAHETGRKYKLIDLDNSQIERTAAELVDGSKLLQNRDLWVANFRAIVGTVQAWCGQRPDLIQLAFVDVRSTKVVFYFVPDATSYDLDLGRAMTDLEIVLGGAGIGRAETLQVPPKSIDHFVGPKSFLLWERPHPSSDANA